jgi:hypothetical protein
MNNEITFNERENEELDISWINELKIPHNNIQLQLGPLFQLEINYIYINLDNEIEYFFKEIHNLTNETNVFENQTAIKQEHLLKIIQSNKIQNNKRFRLNEILKYTVDFNEDEFTKLVESTIANLKEDTTQNSYTGGSFLINKNIFGSVESFEFFNNPHFLKQINYIDDIIFKSVITLFHNVNALYLVYIENDSIQSAPKPVLKIDVLNKPHILKKTKKVRLNEHNISGLNHTRKTNI